MDLKLMPGKGPFDSGSPADVCGFSECSKSSSLIVLIPIIV